ncbi:MAG: hypothetical protein Q9192_006960 [Flavoplaca navasiana]
MSQFHWPLLKETSFGLPPGSTMNLLPKRPADLPMEKTQEQKATEARETFFDAYNGLNRGTIAGGDHIGSQNCIVLNMPSDKVRFPDLDLAIPLILDETSLELKRLIEHPEILPQGTSQYLDLVAGELELLLDAVHLKETERHKFQEFVKKHWKHILPDYDEKRTTWQQFLHNQAPGSGFPKEQMHQHGCTQMATAACQLLANHKSEEYEGCSKSLEEARGKPLPQCKDTVAGLAPHQDYVRRTDWKTYLPTSKRPAPREPVSSDGFVSLQNLANRYPRMAKRWTRVRLRPQTYRANLVNELAITEMRRLIKPSTPTNVTTKATPMAKPQGHRGITKTKKKNVAVKSGKAKATRSVNSFMMFRCQYAVIFEAFQQKVISTYIVFLWQHDPFKAKWALLAKAYSVIRDHVGKEHAPLDAFLSLVANFVGIIGPHSYLSDMGWEISVDELGNVSLEKNDTTDIDVGMLSTNISVEDIIAYASAHGYVAMGLINKGPISQPSMTMAASAQSLPPATPGTDPQPSPLGLQQNQISSDVANLSAPFGSCDMAFDPYDKEMDLVRFMAPDAQRSVTVNINPSLHHQVAPNTPTSNTTLIANPLGVNNVTDWDPDFDMSIYAPYERNAFDSFDISEWVHQEAYAL